MTPSLKPSTYFQLKGYPGLKNMAPFITPLISPAETYVEPFAGMGRTVEPNKHSKVVLNDLSDHAVRYLRDRFPFATVTQEDFTVCLERWDSPTTTFLIDPPWRKNIYTNNVGPVCDRTPIEYYELLLNKILPRLRGKWILCVDKDEHEIGKRVSKSIYKNITLEHPSQKLFGRPVAVRLCFSKTWSA